MRPVKAFDLAETVRQMQRAEGRHVLSIDMGSDKIAATLSRVENRHLVPVVPTKPHRSTNGVGYLEYMEDLAALAASQTDLTVGFSFAGPIDGTKPKVYTNVPAMIDRVNAQYGGDLANIFPNAKQSGGGNDAGTGLVAATVEAYRQHPNLRKVVYIINGGGLGGAVYEVAPGETVGRRDDAEPGHIQVVREYNPFNQVRPCEQPGSPTPSLTCVEKIGSSGQGVEKTFNALVGGGADFKGENIAQLYMQGNQLANNIYDNAAALTAVTALGLDQASNGHTAERPIDPTDTVVIFHGGIFHVDGFGERVEQYLRAHLAAKNVGYDEQPVVMYTKDFSANACMDGAAILALTDPSTIR